MILLSTLKSLRGMTVMLIIQKCCELLTCRRDSYRMAKRIFWHIPSNCWEKLQKTLRDTFLPHPVHLSWTSTQTAMATPTLLSSLNCSTKIWGAIHERSQMWSHVRSVVWPTIPACKLFTKHVARTNVVNLVVNLRHTCSCRTPIVNLKIWQIINNYATYTHVIVIYLRK